MKNIDILKAIGNIDESFIAGAEVKNDSRAVKEKRSPKVWGKWAGAVAAVLAVCVIGGIAIPSMGRASQKSDMEMISAPEMMQMKVANSGQGYVDYAAEREGYGYADNLAYAKTEMASLEPQSGNTSDIIKQDVKLIYTADLSLQSTGFDETLNQVKALVDRMGGYFEVSSVENGGMFNSGYRYGYYTIRIPVENYRSFLESVGEGSHVVRLQENVRDIGETYFNIESQIETLKIKEERLQELLKKAENLGDIITIESELSNVEQQLKMYGTDLNHYDSLIDFSTIRITLEEVSVYSESAYKENFGARFVRAIKRGATNFVEGVQDCILWIGSNFIGIIIFAAIVFVIFKFHLIKKLIRKITGKQ